MKGYWFPNVPNYDYAGYFITEDFKQDLLSSFIKKNMNNFNKELLLNDDDLNYRFLSKNRDYFRILLRTNIISIELLLLIYDGQKIE